MNVYLCHKCGGLLTECDLPRAYGCGCMSGYVRDWQTPTPITAVYAIQISELIERLALYDLQDRRSDNRAVVETRRQLAALAPMVATTRPSEHQKYLVEV